MTTVHKFPLAAIPDVELMMPAGARLLHVGHQDGALMLWAEVDEQAPAERRQFVVVGTGWGKPADAEVYVGTVQAPNGLVWHVFEVAPLPVPEVGEERQAMIDQLRDQAIELDMLREALGVPYEPHQSLLERMLEAARGRAGSGAAPEPPAQQPMSRDREVWRAALTLANNICVQESDRYNGDDRNAEAEAAARCARRCRMWIDPEDEQLAELLDEAGIGKGESNEG